MPVPRVTSQDVAEAAGVSRTTVSLVLNNVEGTQISEPTRQRVIAAAQKLGYVPDAAARALASRRAQILGLVLTRSTNRIASDAFLTQILDGLIEIVHRYEMRLILEIVEPQHQKEAYIRLVKAKHIDGMLLSGPRFDDQALEPLAEVGFPVVLMGQLPGSSFYCVDVDNIAAARLAVTHLIKLGHRRIACITNAHRSYTASAHRLQGYKEALQHSGILFDPRLVRYGDFTPQSGFMQMKDLLESKLDFTAVFVASDDVAIGAKAAICEQGLHIPDDIALVGFDDIPLAEYLDPPLTTIHLPAIELARRGSQLLIQQLKGNYSQERNVILDTHLVVRQSCGAHSASQATV